MLVPTLLLIAQAATPSPQPYWTWSAIPLGEPASALRPVLGDPIRILQFQGGTRRVARFWLPGSDSTYAIVIEEHGYVVGVDVFTNAAPAGILVNVAADPSGVRLGDTLATAKAKNPQLRSSVDDNGAPILIGRVSPAVGVLYDFQGDRVSHIYRGTKLTGAQPELAPLTAPSGDAVSSAILDLQQNETDGVAWEYRYLAFHPCTDTARWQLQRQSLLHEGGHSYDDLHVVCPPTKAERDFYFDITSYFGKL